MNHHYVDLARKTSFGEPFSFQSGRGRLENTGDPLSRKLHVVCDACNSGWMSRLQKKTKNVLGPIINGEWPLLFRMSDLKTLAAWATMFTMVFEFADPHTVGVPFTQRNEFRRTQTPPNDWKIWIAPFNGKRWSKRTHHWGLGLYPGTPEENRSKPCNVQITTAVIGSFLFQTFRFDPSIGYLDLGTEYETAFGLNPIWPLKQPPKTGAIQIPSDDNADHIAFALRNILIDMFP